jgi:hypothetical protein
MRIQIRNTGGKFSQKLKSFRKMEIIRENHPRKKICSQKLLRKRKFLQKLSQKQKFLRKLLRNTAIVPAAPQETVRDAGIEPGTAALQSGVTLALSQQSHHIPLKIWL